MRSLNYKKRNMDTVFKEVTLEEMNAMSNRVYGIVSTRWVSDERIDNKTIRNERVYLVEYRETGDSHNAMTIINN